MIRIGIVGAGLIGGKRAEAIKKTGLGRVVAVADVDQKKAEALASICGCSAEGDWRALVRRSDLDVVIVSVPNKFAMSISVSALKNGKHVLIEKPFGRNSKESQKILSVARHSGRLLMVGFNHRFHPGIMKAKEIFDKGIIGKLLFIRSRYGHGGRMGMEKEWRFQKNISGGGELLDQGVHVIDLARWFAGDFKRVYGLVRTKFWKTKLEDNAFALLENDSATVSLHVSATNWKNIFSFEIFGDKGFLSLDGKGGSYGEETLTLGIRPNKFGVPKTKIFRFSGDTSWENEWRNFVYAISRKKKIIGDGLDGLMANKIVEAVERSSKSQKVVCL